MKAVAYYRSRPSEPEASEQALRLQHEAVQMTVEKYHLDVIAEFVEREGEAGSETCPAYAAAVHAALAQTCEDWIDVALLNAACAAIGTGEPFGEPHLEGEHKLLHFSLEARSIPALPRIELPAGAPGHLCLYADFSPRQVQTLVYLCNAGPEPLAEVTVATSDSSVPEFRGSKPGEHGAEVDDTRKKQWDAVAPATCVLLDTLGHRIVDESSRRRVTYTDTMGQRWTAKAHDHNLNAWYLLEDPERVWVAFDPAQPADQAGAEERAEDISCRPSSSFQRLGLWQSLRQSLNLASCSRSPRRRGGRSVPPGGGSRPRSG